MKSTLGEMLDARPSAAIVSAPVVTLLRAAGGKSLTSQNWRLVSGKTRHVFRAGAHEERLLNASPLTRLTIPKMRLFHDHLLFVLRLEMGALLSIDVFVVCDDESKQEVTLSTQHLGDKELAQRPSSHANTRRVLPLKLATDGSWIHFHLDLCELVAQSFQGREYRRLERLSLCGSNCSVGALTARHSRDMVPPAGDTHELSTGYVSETYTGRSAHVQPSVPPQKGVLSEYLGHTHATLEGTALTRWKALRGALADDAAMVRHAVATVHGNNPGLSRLGGETLSAAELQSLHCSAVERVIYRDVEHSSVYKLAHALRG